MTRLQTPRVRCTMHVDSDAGVLHASGLHTPVDKRGESNESYIRQAVEELCQIARDTGCSRVLYESTSERGTMDGLADILADEGFSVNSTSPLFQATKKLS